ncbi:hypothetical protein [Hymenobacter terrestris]|uniref:DUF2975 domain-containing protein n=1 Tax=Hymenobacter terrestris TaxID=2748310 RepID=A0ABX2Q231_9BACT|nr:hypothetical protein [Hymenobacter terrestris]NVO84076.1 hypothetical protein [Hymenobacter terrestris]
MNDDIQTKIKRLAYYQIFGGVIGIILIIWLIAQTVTITGILILIFIFAAGLYSFSIYCGNHLLKEETEIGLKLSIINQALQVINFSVSGFAFKFVAGLALIASIDYTDDFKFTFNFSLSESQFTINSEEEFIIMGFNMVAIYLVYFIDKLQQEIENIETMSKASKSIDLSAQSPAAEEI